MPNEFVIKNGFISQNNSNVSGLLTTTTFRLTSGATNGYVLTSDGSGNATWNPLSATTGYFDVFVTGGTYSNGSATFTNNTGGTFNVTGFYTGQTSYVNSVTTGTGLSGDSTTGNITLVNTAPDQVVTLNEGNNIDVQGTYPNFTIAVTGLTDNNRFVTGFTYDDANTFTISDNSGSTYSATFNIVTGLTANTISATTYQNLPTDVFVSGGTYSAGTATFTNTTGSTFMVTGFSDFQYFISGSSPSGITLNIGDRWYNLNNGAEYVWNDDGNTTQWVQPAGIPGPQGIQGIQGISGNTGPQGPQGDAGFSGLYVTTGITASTQTLTTGFTYYGIIHTGNVDLTLPSPVGNDGFNLNIKDESGNSGIYRIRIITPSGSIDGNSYVDMNINYMSLHLVARNNNWWLI